MAQGEDELRKIWKEYFEYLYNIGTQEQVAVHTCGFDEIRRGNNFGGEPLGKVEVEVEWASSRIERPQVRMRSQEK